MENEDKALKSQIAMRRCAKAALLLHSLKSLHRTTEFGDEEMQEMKIKQLKIQLLKERSKNNKMKLCTLVELLVQLVLLLFLWTFFLVLFFKAY